MNLYPGDCLDVLRTLPENSVDSLVTDPPAGISFMGKNWDSDKGGRAAWIEWLSSVMQECLRVMKPGAYGLVWAIPRTSHWTATALEDAGFEIRDIVMHLFGSGFPKSLDISKAIDQRQISDSTLVSEWLKTLGSREEIALASGVTSRQVDHWIGENTPCPQIPTAKRFKSICDHFKSYPEWSDEMFPKLGDILGEKTHSRSGGDDFGKIPGSISHSRTEIVRGTKTQAAKQWEGWGTALKPAAEHWILVRKPCSEKNVTANVLKYGTGAINIRESRVGTETRTVDPTGTRIEGRDPKKFEIWQSKQKPKQVQGRFPANVVQSCFCEAEHTEDCAVRMLNEQSGPCKTGNLEPHHLLKASENKSMSGANQERHPRQSFGGDEATGAARFFYCAKASKKDKGEDNTHPTVKPQALMTYLIRMITPPGGTVLDPFMGSGSTGVAAIRNGFEFTGIEKEPEYFDFAKKRILSAKETQVKEAPEKQPSLFE